MKQEQKPFSTGDISRLPPQNLEAEASVLGACLIDKAAVKTMLAILDDSDFYLYSNKYIFQAIKTLQENKQGIDSVTVINEIKKMNRMGETGGLEYLQELMSSTPAVGNAEYYCNIIKDMSIRRKGIIASINLQKEFFNPDSKPDNWQAHVSNIIQTISGGTTDGRLSQRVRNLIMDTSGDFNIEFLWRAFDVKDKENKDYIRKIILRMIKEDLISRVPGKEGWYRKIERLLSPLNWKEANTDNEFKYRFPFDLHEIAKLYPRSIVIVGGKKSAGKTGLLLNVVKMNMDLHPVRYFSSELSPEELKNRIMKFGEPIDSWNFEAYYRTRNFADVIDPDAVNVIDYMAIYEEFYKIGKYIQEVHERLNQGIAVIALQMDKWMRGGEFVKELARLCITLETRKENNVAKIEVLKTPRDYIDSNGEKREYDYEKCTFGYKIMRGCDFVCSYPWGNHKEVKPVPVAPPPPVVEEEPAEEIPEFDELPF